MKFPEPPSFRPTLSAVQSFSLRILPYWIAAGATALISICFAQAFRWSEEHAFEWLKAHPALAFLTIPSVLLLSSWMAARWAPFASGSGIPQVMAALEIGKTDSPALQQLIGLRVIVVKFVGACVSVIGGGATGREGPTLQVAAGVFYAIEKRWRKFAKLDPQSMILAGSAAGLASAFNTPLGGVIFAVEELAKVHISHVRTAVFHSVLIAGILTQAVLGNYLYLGRVTLESGPLINKIYLALVMAFIGGVGAVFSLGLVRVGDWRAKLNLRWKSVFAVVCGLLLATLFYFVGLNAIGSGREVIVHLLTQAGEHVPLSLAFTRMLANFLTYITGAIGGVFAPALSVGAALGGWSAQLFEGVNSQIWVLGGMVAFLTGVTRSPFTSMILVLEMTDSHGVILDLMMAAIFAQGFAKLVDPVSFYEHMSHRMLGTLGMLNETGHREAEPLEPTSASEKPRD